MFKQILAYKNGTPLSVDTSLNGEKCLVVDSQRVLSASWQSASITTAKTTTIISAKQNESVLLTDLVVILSQNMFFATITPRFSDGTNTVDFFVFNASTAPFQFSHAFQGGIRGWKNADFQIVTNQATTVSIFVGFVNIPTEQTMPYGAWNENR